MVGSVWHNVVLSTFISVYVFLLSLTNNTPQHSLIRAIITLILAFLITYIFRRIITYIFETKTVSQQGEHKENVQENKEPVEHIEDQEENDEMNSTETAKHIRNLMNE
ncbi:uncharacterized membrane protein YraQ (UPF0718 family) [Alkalibacillus filiformis]|uniref:Uncharacterized membrane protein YraQ (UPF0718 family) n=1 Tax=Alkalibacillus filiformis TaxID=200990 RepID=A0ABU0DQD0_9BACI|nr:hypothetical protein [Alkalibacillus filiformis]MDQ0350646.1 uncharacterized membrane protein YraQ (UPF0718 family) [Alkalibacillus filiformis]